MKKTFFWIIAAACTFAPALATAQAYPARPVKVIIPYPTGGGSEGAARLVVNHYTQAFNQAFVIEPKPGGNTVIGTEAAAKSPADGYTLLLTGGSTMSVQPFVFAGKLPYDPIDGFSPISMVSRFPFILLVPASLPVNSLPEYVAYVKARPKQLSYGSNGSGTISHLGMETLKLAAGLDLLHVPYKGFGPMMPDLLAARVSITMADLAPVSGHLKAGTLRPIAVTSKERWGQMPQLPTIAELGNPGYEIEVWFGLFAPAKTPPEIVSRLGTELRKYLATPEAKEAFARLGHDPAPTSSEAVRERIINEQKAFSKTIKEIGLKPE